MEILDKTIQFSKEVVSEGSKVHWPTKDQLLKATGVVVAVIFVIGIYMAGVDYLFATIFRLIGR